MSNVFVFERMSGENKERKEIKKEEGKNERKKERTRKEK
jgi:hypothetical protein